MATTTKTINAGPVGLKPRGAYSSTDTYTLLDCVLYNHDSWVCIAMNADGSAATVTGQAPADGSQYWKALTDGGRAAVAVGTQVRTDFDTWFGATANAGIRKTVSDWLTSVQTAFNDWFSDSLSTGVRKIWNDWFSDSIATGVRYIWDHWFGEAPTQQSQGSGVQGEWAGLKTDATTATNRANTAAAVCEDWNGHPPYVADGTQQKPGDANYWYTYDVTTGQYVKGPYAKGDNLDWDSMSQAEQQALAQMVLDHIAFDDEPTEGSDKAVKSGWLYNAFAVITTALSGKQDTLTFATVAESQAAANELT